MGASLEDYPWLPRMIDKARAARAGTLGDHYRYPCPIDATCLARLGISAEAFADVAENAASDEAVLTLLRARGIPTAAIAAFDPVALYKRIHHEGS